MNLSQLRPLFFRSIPKMLPLEHCQGAFVCRTLRAEDREWPEEVCAAWDRLHEQDALGRFANAADTLNAQSALADIRLPLDHWK